MSVLEINCLTGESIQREMNEEELNQKELDYQNSQNQQKQAQLLAEKKSEAIEKLQQLGLDLDSLKALGLA